MSSSNMFSPKNRSISFGYALFLCFAVAVYSSSGIFMKLASENNLLSLQYVGYVCGVVVILGIYAILWQIVLKKVHLSQAYPFRSLGVVYGLAIAGLAFHESITFFNLLGGALVVLGILVISTGK